MSGWAGRVVAAVGVALAITLLAHAGGWGIAAAHSAFQAGTPPDPARVLPGVGTDPIADGPPPLVALAGGALLLLGLALSARRRA